MTKLGWTILGVVVLLVTGLIIVTKGNLLSQPGNKPAVRDTKSSNPGPQTTPSAVVTANYFYPIRNFAQRLTLRKFGQYLTVQDRNTVPCGASFTGYHDGDDLETTPAEENVDVQVFAVTNGTINTIEQVSGYGGLLIMKAVLNGSPVTINYGHINLASVKVKVGDEVKPGQILANLGTACSTQTDGERKHLHLAIHKGTTVDVRGYVQSTGELSQWMDPAQVLQEIQAREP